MKDKLWKVSLHKLAHYISIDNDHFVYLGLPQQHIVNWSGIGRVISKLVLMRDEVDESVLDEVERAAANWLVDAGFATRVTVLECGRLREPRMNYAGVELMVASDYAVEGPEGRTWTVVWWDGPRCGVGPLFGGVAGGCPECLRRCITGNQWLGQQIGMPVLPQPGDLLERVEEWLFGQIAAGLNGEELLERTAEGKTVVHLYRRFVDCKRCGKEVRGKKDIDGAGCGLGVFPSEPRGERAEDVIELLRPFVSSIAGIASSLKQEKSGRKAMASYVMRYLQPVCPEEYRPKGGIIGPGSCSSRGWTEVEAEAACLAEGIERYSICFQGNEQRKVVPESRDKECLWAENLADGDGVWIPAERCLMNYGPQMHEGLWNADSSGCAAGSSLAEASYQALLEALERQAAGRVMNGACVEEEVELDEPGEERWKELVNEMRAEGWRLRVYRLPEDAGVAVYLGLGLHEERGWVWSAGAHGKVWLAFGRALSELWQLTQGKGQSGEPGEIWSRKALIRKAPKVGQRVLEIDFGMELSRLVGQLKEQGRIAYRVNLTRADIGFPVVRVLLGQAGEFQSEARELEGV